MSLLRAPQKHPRVRDVSVSEADARRIRSLARAWRDDFSERAERPSSSECDRAQLGLPPRFILSHGLELQLARRWQVGSGACFCNRAACLRH